MRLVLEENEYQLQFKPGDAVTVYNSKIGHANYDAKFVRYEVDRNGSQWAVVSRYDGEARVSADMIIPSERSYFFSLKREDVLTMDFIASLTHRDDSIWCRKIWIPRVDRDPGMENVTGADAYIGHRGQQSYKVDVTNYITKNYQETKESNYKERTSLSDPLIKEALDILKMAPHLVVNYAGYQRTFEE